MERSKLKYCLCFVLIFASSFLIKIQAQDDFYDIGQVREIKIYFELDNWKEVMDSLFLSGDNYSRIKAEVVIDGDAYPECGVRYKGFSSWNSDEMKNPFNIRLDYTYKNQNHQGYKKLKLSNVIYDPSFVREALSYSIARQYIPSSGANYANIYINDTLIGLYSNVEAVDDCFTDKYFGSHKNPFFKGNPESLSYPFGQNANLAYTHGDDSTGYMAYYKLESEYGWTELFNFIDVLNNDTANISNVLNVDRALWMHAFNYTLLNLDSYIAYAQNYYLYQEDNGKFNTILWDLNMSFGSFRHSDGSYNFQGLTVEEIETLDPLQHLSFSISPRPLVENLFRNSTYKKMYLAHIRTILDENITNGNYLSTAEELHETIESYVLADTNKFYSDDDFQNNIYSEVGESTDLYPGLQDLMNARIEYLETYSGIRGEPEYEEHYTSSDYSFVGSEIIFSVDVEYADNVFLFYRFNESNAFNSIEMSDDGFGEDTNEDDNKYSASLIPNGTVMQYYFWAENDSAGSFLPAKAASSYFSIMQFDKGYALINEIKYSNVEETSNLIGIDWIELYNPSDRNIDLVDYRIYYGNTFCLIEDTVIEDYGHLVVYPQNVYFADQNPFEFGSTILTLSYKYFGYIDAFESMECSNQRTFGSFPDGSDNVLILDPTQGSANKICETAYNSLNIYPNPFTDEVNLSINADFEINQIKVFNHAGDCIYMRDGISSASINETYRSSVSFSIDTHDWSSGMYFVSFIGNNKNYSAKFVKIK